MSIAAMAAAIAKVSASVLRNRFRAEAPSRSSASCSPSYEDSGERADPGQVATLALEQAMTEEQKVRVRDPAARVGRPRGSRVGRVVPRLRGFELCHGMELVVDGGTTAI
ncbi:hypothetical protein ABQE45_18125 [Mycobacteroides chelonae]